MRGEVRGRGEGRGEGVEKVKLLEEGIEPTPTLDILGGRLQGVQICTSIIRHRIRLCE